MEVVIDNKKKKTDKGFEFEFIDYSKFKNNGFDISNTEFSEVDRHVGVKSVNEMENMNVKESIKNKVDYIELDENLEKEYRKSHNKAVIDSIKFNGLKGKYTVEYHENGVSKVAYYMISKSVFYDNVRRQKQKVARSNILGRRLKKLDMNLYTNLRYFDKKHETNCAEEYLKGTKDFAIRYDNKDIFNNREYTFIDKLRFIATANRQKKNKNVIVENPRKVYFAPMVASFTLLFGLVGINAVSGKKADTTVTSTGKKIVKETNLEDTEAVIDKLVTEAVKDKAVSDTTTKTEKTENVKEEVNTTKKNSIHDSFTLNNVDLEYSPIENIKHINTNNLEYVDNYKISLVSAYDGNTILCNEKIANIGEKSVDELIADLNNEYGSGIKIYINWDAFDKDGNQLLSNVGWSDAKALTNSNVSTGNKVYQKTLAKK